MSTMTEMGNLEIIFVDWLDAMRRGDVDRMAGRLAPDVVHQGIRPELICPDRKAVIARLRDRAGRRPDVTAIELVEAGDQVVMSVRGEMIGVPADAASDQPRGQATVVFTLREGRIVHMQDYLTREAALNAVDAPHDVWQ
ncbi:MAG: SnoaL-like domain [Actinomycetota bacterium]|nr:SnoaL-like domain [Actinomycetota bacterium]